MEFLKGREKESADPMITGMNGEKQEMGKAENHTATISNAENYTIFQFGESRLKFAAPYSLEYYDSVVQWKHGYLVVMAKYQHQKQLEEEYIDLNAVLDALLIDRDRFLSRIDAVEVAYA